MKTRITLIILLTLAFRVEVCGQAAAGGPILSTRPATSLDLPVTSTAEKKSLLQLQETLAAFDRQIAELEKKKAEAVSRYFDKGAVPAQSKEPEVFLGQK